MYAGNVVVPCGVGRLALSCLLLLVGFLSYGPCFSNVCAIHDGNKNSRKGTCDGTWIFNPKPGILEKKSWHWPERPFNCTQLDNVTRDQCEQQCIHGMNPECRSFNYHTHHHRCLLHAKSDENVGYYIRQTDNRWTYYEKTCKRRPCPGHWAYTKVKGMRLIDHQHFKTSFIAENCKDACLLHSDSICQSYSERRSGRLFSCTTSKQYSKTVPQNFVAAVDFTYYERTCLPKKRVCLNGTWQMDIVQAWKMTTGIVKVFTGMNSTTCKEKCLQEEEFDCHSVNYDVAGSVCELGEEDRETRPNMMRQANGWLYFDKLCMPDDCKYISYNKIDSAIFEGKTISRVSALSREQCLKKCTLMKLCRSANFNRLTRECHLSTGIYFNDVRRFRVKIGWEYHEKLCRAGRDISGVMPLVNLKTQISPYCTGDNEILKTYMYWTSPNPPKPGNTMESNTYITRRMIARIHYGDVPFRKMVLSGSSFFRRERTNLQWLGVPIISYYGVRFMPGRRYILSVRQWIANNTSPFSGNLLMQQPSEGLTGRPKNVKIRGIRLKSAQGFNTVDVTWTKLNTVLQDTAAYIVHYKKLTGKNWVSVMVDKDKVSVTVRNLTVNTPYLFKVEAKSPLEEDTGYYKHVSATTTFFTGTLRFATERMYDCTAVYNEVSKEPGFYTIWPLTSPKPFVVLCEKGWTIVQKRSKNLTSPFDRDWADFKKGFGNGTDVYWIGLDKLYYLTNQANYKLSLRMRLSLRGFVNDLPRLATYRSFRIEDETNLYRLHTDRFWSKGLLDGFDYTADRAYCAHHNGQPFSTRDRDFDRSYAVNCAQAHGGGWWWDTCGYSVNAQLCFSGIYKCAYWPKVRWRSNISIVAQSLMKIKIHNRV